MVDLIRNTEKRELRVDTPAGCLVCKMKTDKWIKRNPDKLWLKIDVMPGISLFKCPSCHAAYFNNNAAENNAKMKQWAEEDANKRIVQATTMPEKVVNLRG